MKHCSQRGKGLAEAFGAEVVHVKVIGESKQCGATIKYK